MSKEVSIFTQQKAVTVSGRRSALAETMSKGNVASNRRIATNTNGTFKKKIGKAQVGETIKGEFNCIIVNALPSVSRIFYKEAYDADKEATLPNCWSNLGDKPEEGAADKQSANCASCPQNIAGSGGGTRKACRYQRRVAILLEGDPSGDVWQFAIPAKSLFGKGTGNVHPFEEYVKYLLLNKQAPDTVVTTVAYDTNAETMELTFSPVREVSDEEYELVQQAQQQPEADMYTKITVAQADGVSKLPKTEEAKPKIERSEEPEEVEFVEVQEAEPVKRAKKEEETVDASDSLVDSVFEKWAVEDEE